MNVEKRQLAKSISSRAPERQAARLIARPLAEALALTILLVVAFVGLLNVDRLRTGPSVDFADPPVESGMDLIGINLAEQNGAYTYRWTTGYMFGQIPHGLNAAQTYIATTRFRAANPAGPQPLTFLANERPLVTTTPSTGFRTYRMLVSAPPSNDVSLRFAIQTTPFTTTADTRKLGVMMTSIALEPLHSFDWTGTLVLVVALAALWVWLRWRGAPLRDALLIYGVVVGALLALSAVYRPAPLIFPLLGVLALLGCAASAWLARDTWSRLALAALSLLMTFSGVLWPSWMTDDAIISFRYAENLVAGNGLVYNVGERVEGYTNFLWTMLAALVLWLDGDPVWWAYLAGVVLALAILLLTFWLARQLIGSAWALVAALFIATSQSLLIYTARGAGLETGLFTLLVLAGSALVLTMDGRRLLTRDEGRGTRDHPSAHPLTRSPAHPLMPGLVGLIFALATLTRPEGALVMALTVVYVTWLAIGSRQSAVKLPWHLIHRLLPLLVGYLLIFVPYFVWRYNYYGEWLPNTFYAKTGGGLRQAVRGLGYAAGFALAFGGPLLLLALMPTILQLLPRRHEDTNRSSGNPSSIVRRLSSVLASWRGYLLLLVSVYSAYIIAVGGDHFPGERFFVPLVPWLAILLADGLAWLFRAVRRRPLLGRLAPMGLALLLLLYSGYALERSAVLKSVNQTLGRPYNAIDLIVQGDDESVWVWRELGWWFRDHAAPGESVAAMGAGAIAYYSDHETIDLLGLNDKHIARVTVVNAGEGTAGHEKRDPAYVLNERRPTYIPRIWDEYFGGEAVLRGPYQLITIQTRYGREMELWKRVQ